MCIIAGTKINVMLPILQRGRAKPSTSYRIIYKLFYMLMNELSFTPRYVSYCEVNRNKQYC